tara:strand:+ start:1933 stop:2109 length:177 start_codon:yes stop_codon:yes gene_type:complete
MILTQEIIENYSGVTIYQMDNGKPVGAVCTDNDGRRIIAKDKAQAEDWWDTDKWYRRR